MGKEGWKEILTMPTTQMGHEAYSQAINEKIFSEWTFKKGADSQEEIKDDGYVNVTIKTPLSCTNIMCTGIANEGNKEKALIDVLKRNGFIPRKIASYSIYIFNDFLWSLFDSDLDTFGSGDRLLVTIWPRGRKSLKKSSHKRVK